jgi:MFS family permease
MLLPTVPLFVKRALGGGEVAVGISVGAFSVTALVLRPFVGRLSDVRGRRLVMLIGMVLFGLSVAGYLVAASVPVLVLMRLVTGAGAAFYFVGAATAVTDIAPEERRGEVVSFFSLALYAGVGIGPVIGEAAIRGGDDFALAWWLTIAAAAAAFVLAIRMPDTRPPRGELGPVRIVHPAGLLPGMVALTSIWGMAGFFAFTPLYVRDLELGESTFVFLLFSVVVMLIRGFGAKIPDRLGAVRAARAALSISAVGLIVIGAWGETAGLLVGTVILGIGSALAFPALMSLTVASAPPSQRGAAIGTFTAFVDLAFGLGPVSLGFVAHLAGLRAVYFAAAAVAIVGLVLLEVRRQRRVRARRVVPERPVPEAPA